MSRKTKGRPQWFKLPLAIKPIIDSFDSYDVGRALQLSFRYFDTGELPGEDEPIMALTLFSVLKAEIDKSYQDSAQTGAAGKRSAIVRANKSALGNDPERSLTPLNAS